MSNDVQSAVRCTSAEYDGRGLWDAPPFDGNPQWLLDAVKRGDIRVAPQGADYASYWVRTRGGVSFATVGDTIRRLPDGTLAVEETGHWEARARLRWDPAIWGDFSAAA